MISANLQLLLARMAGCAKRECTPREWHRRAIDVWNDLVRRGADRSRVDHYLAISYNNLAVLAERPEEGLKLLHQPEALLKQLDDAGHLDHDGRRLLCGVYHNLGNRLLDLRRLPEARAYYRKSIELLKKLVESNSGDRRDTLSLCETYISLGASLVRGSGKELNEAMEAYDAACSRLEQLVQSSPTAREPLDRLAMVFNNRGRLRRRLGNLDGAREDLTAAHATRARLVELDPTNVRTVSGWGNNCTQLAIFLSDQGSLDEAAKYFTQAVDILTPLTVRYPDQLLHRDRLAQAYSAWAVTESRAGRADRAQEKLSRSIPLWSELSQADPKDPSHLLQLAADHGNRAIFLRDEHQSVKALESAEEARRILEELAVQLKDDAHVLRNLATAFEFRGHLFSDDKQYDQAIASYEGSLKIRRSLAKNSGEPSLRRDVASSLINLGESHLNGKHEPDRARAVLEEAEATLRELVEKIPDDPAYRRDLGLCRFNLAGVYMFTEKWEEALRWEELAGIDLRAACERAPGDTDIQETFDGHLSQLGQILRRLGRGADALQAAMARRELSSENPVHLVQVATDVAACLPGADKNAPTAVAGQEVDSAKVRRIVLEVLGEAVCNGFRDDALLISAPEFKVLADDPDFVQLTKQAAGLPAAPLKGHD